MNADKDIPVDRFLHMIAIIPARGGSKRLPRKNVLPIAGKPLIAYTIEQAQQSRLINRVIVSTDDDEIASVSKRYGAEVVRRPDELSVDNMSTVPVLCHAVGSLEERESIVLLQCTSPIRNQDDIDKAINVFKEQKSDCLFSACRFKEYIWQVKGGIAESINFDYESQFWRGQDFPKQFRANGSIFIYKRVVLDKLNNIFGTGKISVYEMDYMSSFQIDTLEEFELCEYILTKKIQGVHKE